MTTKGTDNKRIACLPGRLDDSPVSGGGGGERRGMHMSEEQLTDAEGGMEGERARKSNVIFGHFENC